MAVTIVNGFEGGTNGTTLTGGSSGNTGGVSGSYWDAIMLGTGAGAVFSTDHPTRTPMAVKITTPATATTSLLKWTAQLGVVPTVYFRIYGYLPALPATNFVLARFDDVSGNECSRLQLRTDGTLWLTDAANANQVQTINPISAGSWFRVEGFVTGSATVGQVEMKLFLTPDSLTPTETKTSVATWNTNQSINTVRYGVVAVNVANITVYLDDLAATDQGYLGPAIIAGTGGVGVKKPSLSGSGIADVPGIGSVSLKKPSLSGSGPAPHLVGTGGVSLKKPALSGSGLAYDSGTGSVSLKKPALSGSGPTAHLVGTGGIAVKKPALSGSGPTAHLVGTGNVSLKKPSLSGSSIVYLAGTGSVSLKKPSLSGNGRVYDPGTGGVSLKKPSLSGSSSSRLIGTGGVGIKKPSLSGSGPAPHLAGTGGIAVKKPAINGSGKGRTAGTGSIAIKKPSFAGIGIERSPTSVFLNGVWLPCVVKARVGGAWVPVTPKVKVGGAWVPVG